MNVAMYDPARRRLIHYERLPWIPPAEVGQELLLLRIDVYKLGRIPDPRPMVVWEDPPGDYLSVFDFADEPMVNEEVVKHIHGLVRLKICQRARKSRRGGH